MFSILRQELDSMIRVIFLVAQKEVSERERLANLTLTGERWSVLTPNGKTRLITDGEMVELSQQLHGWTESVYRFGCAFIHLSNYHNHGSLNPIENLDEQERTDLLRHLRHYHGGPHSDHPSFEELSEYVPWVFEKISSNLRDRVDDLKSGKALASA